MNFPESGPLMNEILDTNVLVRFLVGDVPAHQEQARQWFAEAEKGKRRIMITPLVIAETIFVLESFYKKLRPEIAKSVTVFLSQRWLVAPEREVLLAALGFYLQKIHFVDSYLLAWSETNHAEILTFDKDLKNRTIR